MLNYILVVSFVFILIMSILVIAVDTAVKSNKYVKHEQTLIQVDKLELYQDPRGRDYGLY